MKKVDGVGDSFDGTLSLDLEVKASLASPTSSAHSFCWLDVPFVGWTFLLLVGVRRTKTGWLLLLGYQ